MSDPSVAVKVREIASALRLPFVLRPNNTLVSYKIDPENGSVTVLTEFLDTHETAREVRYVRRGRRLQSWTPRYDFTSGNELKTGERFVGLWKYREIVMWDDTFKPYTEHKIGRIETPEEYRARRRWEGDQYRVGSAKSPMDSAYRVTFDYSPMTDYWNK